MVQGESSAQFGYEDHFTPTRTRKKRKNRTQTEHPSPSVLLERLSEELARTDWLRDTKRMLHESLEQAFVSSAAAPDVLCLGLGSPTSSRDARAQLALLLAVCDDLRIEHANVSIFDPIFVEQDRQLLARLGLTCLPENLDARHNLHSQTIVFMPHCDLCLYDNLFRENWSKEQLPCIFLIANRLSEYAESMPSRRLEAERPCIARLAPYLTSRPLPSCPLFPTAFNNTAVQFVRASALSEWGPDWWALPPPPPPPQPSTATATSPAPVTSADSTGIDTGPARNATRAAESTTAPALPRSPAPERESGGGGGGPGKGEEGAISQVLT